MSFLTIFTPTYNRSKLLMRAYESLLEQEEKNFEWIIVDDGSNDDTDSVVDKMKEEQRINIRYFKQPNSGKHIAINNGLKHASSELFLILDSDDELKKGAVSTIFKEWQQLEKEHLSLKFGGLVFNKVYSDDSPIGNVGNYLFLDATIIDFRYKMKFTGDKLEVFKTQLLKRFPFPDNNEKFCPEALVWNRIGCNSVFRFVNQAVFQGEYLPEGLTSKITKIRKESPYNMMVFYSELATYNIPIMQKIRATINFWRFSIYGKNMSFIQKMKMSNMLFSILALPLGLLFSLKDKGE